MSLRNSFHLGLGIALAACVAVWAYRINHAGAAGIPPANTLFYTGSLDTFGTPDNANHNMSVALYVQGTTTNPVCSTGAVSVTCVNGQFTVQLPSNCVTAIHSNPNLGVQVTIDNTVLPTTDIAAVPFAVEADTASNAAPGSALQTQLTALSTVSLGAASSNPGSSCKAILAAVPAAPSGVYWLKSTGSAFQAFCDMVTNGGGWTLVLQASDTSQYVYSHAIWTATSVPGGQLSVTNAIMNQDAVSPGFYQMTTSTSMLCMGDVNHCTEWTHGTNTPQALANCSNGGNSCISGSQGAEVLCTTASCTANTLPAAIDNATTGTNSPAWERFGYVNDVNSSGFVWVRVGYSGDGDSSDSSDTGIGIGMQCNSSCISSSGGSGAINNRGAGYYLYTTWANHNYGSALNGALRAYLYIQ